MLLRRVVDGKVQTKLIDGEFYPKASESQTPYRYEVSGLLDLDGDGRLEIIIYSAYYEGATVTVWQSARESSTKFSRSAAAPEGDKSPQILKWDGPLSPRA